MTHKLIFLSHPHIHPLPVFTVTSTTKLLAHPDRLLRSEELAAQVGHADFLFGLVRFSGCLPPASLLFVVQSRLRLSPGVIYGLDDHVDWLDFVVFEFQIHDLARRHLLLAFQFPLLGFLLDFRLLTDHHTDKDDERA